MLFACRIITVYANVVLKKMISFFKTVNLNSYYIKTLILTANNLKELFFKKNLMDFLLNRKWKCFLLIIDNILNDSKIIYFRIIFCVMIISYFICVL
jgi:hypothetical protein